ncbi:MAG TPA: hypothetical protein VN628_12165 [Vicinamibacterales bacterium]|nr:hypothetical protein [Vicinamibacterales bacterium]
MITRTNVAVAMLIAAAAVCVEAQAVNGPVPRLNGKPDLSGVWQAERTPLREYLKFVPPEQIALQPDFNDINKYMINVFWDISPQDWPLNPEGARLTEQQQKSGRDFQAAYCLPGSLPAAIMVMNFKMIQAPKEIVVISGNGDPARQIYTDGRRLPKEPNPGWMGSSVGRWDGDTLVVETTGFTEKARLDAFGHPRSETMRVTERYHRRDAGHMDLEITIDDAKYYTRPFSIKTVLNLMPNDDVPEYVCTENEKDNAHFR